MKNLISIRRLLLPVTAFLLTATLLQAQAVKSVSVGDGASFTDHLSLGEDARDMDVMVKIVFDEPNNTLTVSVLSYRNLFVFRESARYSAVVRRNCLRPDLMPYVVETEPGYRFKLSKSLRKAIPQPRKDFVFRRWIQYEGLQPVPTDYRMVNDYIEQSFEILQKRNVVSVTLRDLYLLEREAGHPNVCTLLRGRDLNLQYQIRLLRNPCLGLEDELVTAVKMKDEVKAAYLNFHKTYASGEVGSKEALDTFEETRRLLLTQFPLRQNDSPCPDIRQVTEQYNHYVDSIGLMACLIHVEEVAAPAWEEAGKGLDTKTIYSQARQLDKAVSRYLVSKDDLERQDLVDQCREIVEDVGAMIQRHPPVTAEEQKAVKMYRQAEAYFKKTCKQ